MEVIYKAFDGTCFDNEYDCEDYEWQKQHEEAFKDLIFYDKDENIISTSKLSEETYSKVMHIEIKSQEALQALHDISDYTGFLNYDDPEDVGDWVWYDDGTDGYFKKKE